MLKIRHLSSHCEQHGSPLMRSMWIHGPLALVSSFKVPTDMAITGYYPEAKQTLHNLDENYLRITHVSCLGSQRAPRATATVSLLQGRLITIPGPWWDAPQRLANNTGISVLGRRSSQVKTLEAKSELQTWLNLHYQYLWLLPSVPAALHHYADGMCQAHLGNWGDSWRLQSAVWDIIHALQQITSTLLGTCNCYHQGPLVYFMGQNLPKFHSAMCMIQDTTRDTLHLRFCFLHFQAGKQLYPHRGIFLPRETIPGTKCKTGTKICAAPLSLSTGVYLA